jgi:sulfite reductase (ferredoxin)
MSVKLARQFADVVTQFAADDIRITVNQGYLLKYVRPEALPALFNALDALALAEPGFDSVADITACPGTDSCNLGISSSTGISLALEKVIREEYPDLIHNADIKIKISGCPNSCGQHGLAQIGLHGSSLKHGDLVLPAMQILLGGGKLGGGLGVISDKIIKIPSKRAPQALRMILDDYDQNALEGEYYTAYFQRLGANYFYQMLKPLADLSNLTQDDFIDWGHNDEFEIIKAVGECAGVIIDLVATLLYETEEKVIWAKENFEAGVYADAIYHAYNVFINGAKAMLLGKDVKVNTQIGVMKDFDNQYVATGDFSFSDLSFQDYVLRINKNEPTKEFAAQYIAEAEQFLKSLHEYRASKNISDEVKKAVAATKPQVRTRATIPPKAKVETQE